MILLCLLAAASGPESVVPEGVVISERIDADLDADGVTDAVLVTGTSYTIVFRRGDRWVKHGSFDLPAGGGAFCGGEGGCPGSVSVSGGVITVSYSYGSREVGDVSSSFRYDPRRRRFRQISAQETVRDRIGEYPTTTTTFDFDARTRTDKIGDKTYRERIVLSDSFLGEPEPEGRGNDEAVARSLVPKGWTFVGSERAEMDGDDALDAFLTVRRDEACAFIVLSKKGGERYVANDELARYPCHHRISAKDGVVTLGARAHNTTCKFRRDKRTRRFVLIGRDTFREGRAWAGENTEEISTNFLTRKRETTWHADGKQQRKVERVTEEPSELSHLSICEEPE